MNKGSHELTQHPQEACRWLVAVAGGTALVSSKAIVTTGENVHQGPARGQSLHDERR